MQTWRIWWVRSQDKKNALVKACLDQGAARSAQELLVFTCNRKNWKVSLPLIWDSVKDGSRDDQRFYYGKLIPFIYGYSWLAPLKWLIFQGRALFKPTPREIATERDLREVSVKSTALACQNFMLAISAQGFDTCPMEGFDSRLVRRVLEVPRSEAIVMVISVGERTERGVWGEQFRIPRHLVVKEL